MSPGLFNKNLSKNIHIQITYISYVCKNKIWNYVTYKGWYAIKTNQPTNHSMHICTYYKSHIQVYILHVYLIYNLHVFIEHIYMDDIFVYIYIYKVGDWSREPPKGSLFISYSFAWIAPLTLDSYLIIFSFEQGGIK